MKEDSNDFLRSLKVENREIIDLVSGIIFENVSNVKESLVNNRLKYSNTSQGSICYIYLKNEKVELEFRNGQKFSFEKYNDVDKKEIKKTLNT